MPPAGLPNLVSLFRLSEQSLRNPQDLTGVLGPARGASGHQQLCLHRVLRQELRNSVYIIQKWRGENTQLPLFKYSFENPQSLLKSRKGLFYNPLKKSFLNRKSSGNTDPFKTLKVFFPFLIPNQLFSLPLQKSIFESSISKTYQKEDRLFFKDKNHLLWGNSSKLPDILTSAACLTSGTF